MKKISKLDIKIMTVPGIVLIVIVVLTLVSAKIILDNIGRLNSEISDNQKTENILQTKLTGLQNITQKISGDSQNVVLALPGINPVLNVITNIKNESAQNGLALNGINSNSSAASVKSSDVVTTIIDFEVDGGLSGISEFISKIKNSNPIVKFDSIKIKNTSSGGGDVFSLTTSIFAYWSNFPTTIPAITEPITELTQDEQNVLTKISSNETLNLVENVASSSGQFGRSNPFSH